MIARNFVFFSTLFFLIYLPACSQQNSHTPKNVCFNKTCFAVEIAQTSEERAKGLQLRHSLKKNKGMLFTFSENRRHSFWMKDTYIPLDIIWIDHNKEIVTITPNVQPCKTKRCPTYKPSKKSMYVLEVNAGVSEERGLKVGDRAVFR